MRTTIEKRAIPATGILQEWVAKLGLRHQGVLLTVVRGCDTAPKEDASKAFTRAVRGVLLNTHCANPEDAKSFIEACSPIEIWNRFEELKRQGFDCYPHHFVMHLVHACEVIAFHHPHGVIADVFTDIYYVFCQKLHVRPESPEQLSERLDAEEHDFGAKQ